MFIVKMVLLCMRDRVTRARVILSLFTLLVTGCAVQPAEKMNQSLSQQIIASGLQPDQVAFVVMPVRAVTETTSVQAGIQHNADALMQPASTIKLVSSAVAMDLLGAVWQGETALLSMPLGLNQARRDGILRQTLYIRGKGDPDLDYAALTGLLEQLHSEGVREIRGDIVLDRSWFSPELPDPTAEPFDESPRARYNYIPDALGLNQQMVQLQLRSDATTVTASTLPAYSALHVESALTLTSEPCDEFNSDSLQLNEQIQLDGSVVLQLAGEFPSHCMITEQAAWLSRDVQWRLSLNQFWRQLGGTFGKNSSIRHGVTPSDAIVVAQHFSRPLPQLLQQENKNSDNGIARILALQI